MKTRLIEEEGQKEFEPFDISITFENIDEIKRFYAICNFSPICDFLCNDKVGNEFTSDLRDILIDKLSEYSDSFPESRDINSEFNNLKNSILEFFKREIKFF